MVGGRCEEENECDGVAHQRRVVHVALVRIELAELVREADGEQEAEEDRPLPE